MLLAEQALVQFSRADEVYTQSVSFGDEDLKANAETLMAELKSNLNRISQLDPSLSSSVKATLVDIGEFQSLTTEIVDSMLSGDVDFEKIGTMGENKGALFDKINASLERVRTDANQEFGDLLSQIQSSSQSAFLWSISISIVALAVMSGTTVFCR